MIMHINLQNLYFEKLDQLVEEGNLEKIEKLQENSLIVTYPDIWNQLSSKEQTKTIREISNV